MKKTQTHKKNQSFVLFWLGLLTGALLVVALYSASGSEDLSGSLKKDASMKRYEVGKYEDKAHRAAYDDGYNMYGSLPGDNYGSVPADNYGLNSILNLKLEPVLSQTEYKKTFDVGYKDASMKRYEVGKYADKAHRAAYDDGYDMYGSLPGDNYGSLPADNYGF